MKKITLLCIALLTISVTMAQTTYFPAYDGTFGGATYEQTFTFPTGAEVWAGFANNNTSIYPLSFPNGGEVKFKATVAADAEVYFRFEKNPHPDVDPAIITANVSLLASNPDGTEYSVAIPAHATQTYSSAIVYVVTRDVDVVLSEIKILKFDTDGSTVLKTDFPVYDGTFGGATYEQTFTFPTGAEVWAGFANNNTSIYPLSFPNGGEVKFKATVAADAEVYFRFEKNPHPDVDPAIITANVSLLASNPDGTEYSVAIPDHATQTYSSALVYVVTRDVDVVLSEISITANAATAGVDDFFANAVKLHPNPAYGVVNISTPTNAALEVSVHDLLGKLVIPVQTIQSQLNISSLNPGMYFVNMKQGTNTATKKLLVN